MTERSKLLCKDCKHSFVGWQHMLLTLMSFSIKPNKYFYRCKQAYKADEEEYNAITGPVKVERHYETCASARLRSGVCGMDGSLWEPKHKKHLFLMLTEK